MFDVQFFTADKRVNSTKKYAPISSGLILRCDLNTACSIVNPALVINPTAFPPEERDIYKYNYCYIGIWSRYYFITDWIWNNGLWVAQCKEDVLASFRTDIFNSSLYVMRATYDTNNNIVFNGNIADSKYPTTAAAPAYLSSAVNNPYAIDDQFNLNGVFIVGIINAHSQNGAVTYYAMTMGVFLEFCQKLFNYSSGWLNIDTTEISEDLQKALINPFQYVVSCVYLPISIDDIKDVAYTTTTTINFGWWAVTVFNAARFVNSGMYVTKTTSLAIPRHPLAASRGAYMNLSPYSIYTLRYYPYGTIDIDSEAIAGWNTLDLYSSVDIVTGKAVLDIAVNGRNNPIRTIEAQIGVQVPTASLQTSYTNLVTGKTGLMAAGASLVGNINKVQSERPDPADYNFSLGGFLKYGADSIKSVASDISSSVKQSGGITQMATDILNTAIAASTTAEIQGMQGTGSLYQAQTLTLSGRFLPMAEEDFVHSGRPLMQTRLLSTLRGFVICKDGDIICKANDREKQTIKAYLEGGLFLE